MSNWEESSLEPPDKFAESPIWKQLNENIRNIY